MRPEFPGDEPIDPEEFERAFGFLSQHDGGTDPGAQPFKDSDAQNHSADSITRGEKTIHVPDPAELAGLFDTITAFNTAEERSTRLALNIVDDLDKANLKERYMAEGMTSPEAVDYISATEGEHAPEAEAALLDLEGITLRYQETLRNFGVSIASDFTGLRLEIANPARLIAGLSCISEHNLPAQIQQGLNTLLKEFTGGLWATVINTNGEQVDAYGAIPFWMSHPEPHAYVQATATLEHGQALAAQFVRLGVDADRVDALRNIARYHQEGMLVEWALSHEMGFDENPYQPGGTRPLDYDNKYWDAYFRVLDGAEAKSRPGDTFVVDQREAATLHITTSLGEILGNIEPPLTREKFDAAWPNTDALEAEIAKNMHDPYVAKWVGWRNRLQSYGRSGELQQ